MDGYRWLDVEAVSTVRRTDCDHEESASVTYGAPVGKSVRVALHPVDKHRWCRGTYLGTIRVWYRVACVPPGLDKGLDKEPCASPGSVVGRFQFRVT